MTDKDHIITMAYAATADRRGRTQASIFAQVVRAWNARNDTGVTIRPIPADSFRAESTPVDVAVAIFGWNPEPASRFIDSEPARLLDKAGSHGAICAPVFYVADTSSVYAESRTALEMGETSEAVMRDREDYWFSLEDDHNLETWQCSGVNMRQWAQNLTDFVDMAIPSSEEVDTPHTAEEAASQSLSKTSATAWTGWEVADDVNSEPRPSKRDNPNAAQAKTADTGKRQRQAGEPNGNANKRTGIRGSRYFYKHVFDEPAGRKPMVPYKPETSPIPESMYATLPDAQSFRSTVHVAEPIRKELGRQMLIGVDVLSALDTAWRSSSKLGAVRLCKGRPGTVLFPVEPVHMRDSKVRFIRMEKKSTGNSSWQVTGSDVAGMFGTPVSQLDSWAFMRVRREASRAIMHEGKRYTNVCDSRDVYAALAKFARQENWGGDGDYDILKGYLSYTLCRCRNQNRIVISRNKGYAIFNTGLVQSNGKAIYACFERARGNEDQCWQEWICYDFCTDSQGIFHKDSSFIRRVKSLPDAPTYDDLKFDYDAALDEKKLVSSFNHILFDNLSRIPTAFLRSVLTDCGASPSDADHLTEAAALEAFRKRYADNVSFNNAATGRFAQYYRQAVQLARNDRSVLVNYHPQEMRCDAKSGKCEVIGHRSQVFMPIRFGYDENDPDLMRSLIISQDSTGKTDIRTVYTLAQTYKAARVVQRLDNVGWLSHDVAFATE